MAKIDPGIGPVASADIVDIGSETKPFVADNPAQLIIPANALDSYSSTFDCPTMDEDLFLAVSNFMSQDGGATWQYAGGFTKAPGPWIDKDGKPESKMIATFSRASADGSLVKLSDGTLFQTLIAVSKPITASIGHAITVEPQKKV